MIFTRAPRRVGAFRLPNQIVDLHLAACRDDGLDQVCRPRPISDSLAPVQVASSVSILNLRPNLYQASTEIAEARGEDHQLVLPADPRAPPAR